MKRTGTAMPLGRLIHRTTVGAAAAALALVGAFGVGAGPAAAATTGPTLTMQHLDLVALTADNPVQAQQTWTTNRTIDWSTVTLTVDASGLASLGTVTFGGECTATGLVATCQEQLPPLSAGQSTTSAPFTLTATPGSKLGASGSYTVTGTMAGFVVKAGTGRITVGGPDYHLGALGRFDNLKIGATVTQPITFGNQGNRPAASTDLALVLTPGLRFARHYANCRYRTLVHNGVSYEDRALCHFAQPMLIGEQDALAEPVLAVTTSHAMWDYIDAVVAPGGDHAVLWWVTAYQSGTTWAQGSGPALGLKQLVAGTPSTAPAGSAQFQYDNNGYQIAGVSTNNTADFGITGSSARAAAGQDVTMAFTMANHGPAVFDDRSGGDGTPFVQVTAPPGTTIVSGPGCGQGSGTDWYCSDSPAASFAFPGDSFHFSVTLHVDTVVPHASGTVQLVYGGGPSTTIPYDPNPANNTAHLVLN